MNPTEQDAANKKLLDLATELKVQPGVSREDFRKHYKETMEESRPIMKDHKGWKEIKAHKN